MKKVKIKCWKKMAYQYRFRKDLYVDCNGHYFTYLMENRLPEDRIINVIEKDGLYFTKDTKDTDDCFSLEMIEKFLA